MILFLTCHFLDKNPKKSFIIHSKIRDSPYFCIHSNEYTLVNHFLFNRLIFENIFYLLKRFLLLS